MTLHRSQIMPNSNRGDCGFQSEEFGEEYDRPSKSQRKREMTALQKLGEQLVDASAERVGRIGIPEDLQNAISECRRIKNHEGRRRQLQYVGKLMRSLDEEDIAKINEAVESWKGQSRADTVFMHVLENQREKLLSHETALTEFMQRYPHADVQQLRTLIRNARKEVSGGKPPKAYREIYRLLREIMTESSTAKAVLQDTDSEKNHEQ